jgi:FG-GAP repeat
MSDRCGLAVPLISALLLTLIHAGCPAQPDDDDSGETDDDSDDDDDGDDDALGPPTNGADAKLVGEHPDDFAGMTVAFAGDVNADGYDDVLVGGHEIDWIYLVNGPISGTLSLAQSDAVITSGQTGIWPVPQGGSDVDEDGYSDVLVGTDLGWGNSSARAFVVYGPISGEVPLGEGGLVFDEGIPFVGTRTGISQVGDLDHDGHADYAVDTMGDNGDSTGSGNIHVIPGPLVGDTLGPADALATISWEWGDHYRIAFSYDAGDVDGDGIDDLILFEHENDLVSRVSVFRGPLAGSYSSDETWLELGPYGEFPAVSGRCDVNGDGAADLLLGDRQAGSIGEGGGYLFLGPLAPGTTLDDADIELDAIGADDPMSFAVGSCRGDLDGDGRDEVVISSYNGSGLFDEAGTLHVFLDLPASGTAVTDAPWQLHGEEQWDQLGQSLATAGDVDGDGLDDLLVGAPIHNAGGDHAGAAYLFYGASLTAR